MHVPKMDNLEHITFIYLHSAFVSRELWRCIKNRCWPLNEINIMLTEHDLNVWFRIIKLNVKTYAVDEMFFYISYFMQSDALFEELYNKKFILKALIWIWSWASVFSFTLFFFRFYKNSCSKRRFYKVKFK